MAATSCVSRMRLSSPSIWAASPSPFITTPAPAAAIASRMPRPMPLVDPVISATRPASGLVRCGSSMFHRLRFIVHVMNEHAAQGIDIAVPGLPVDHAPDIVVAGLPPRADAFGAEIDVLGVIVEVEARRQQAH